MYLLRRSAARAVSSKAIFVKPRSITTSTPISFQTRPQQRIGSFLQRRFASDDVTKQASQSTAESAAAEAENFAQTAAEAPVEENLTPAQQSVQSDPTDPSATITQDALSSVAQTATEARPAPGRAAREPTPPNKTLYVGNLYYEVNEDQLKRVFSRFGAIESVRLVLDERGLSRGFGYVQFADLTDAQVAIQNLDMQVFEGRNLVVQYHKAKNQRPNNRSAKVNPPSSTLFIGNLSFEMSDKDLNELFRDIRNVTDVRVAIDRRTGQPRGFAHADFIDVASATKAKEVLAEKVVLGRKLRVDFSQTGRQNRRPRPDSQEESEATKAPGQPEQS